MNKWKLYIDELLFALIDSIKQSRVAVDDATSLTKKDAY